ncbi:hypothetical protein Tco_1293718 [Tanacetum coccineum]
MLGPTFRLLKGTRSSYAELEYDFEECYKDLSEKLDWENPEGGDYPFDLSKPLPLITRGNRQRVSFEFFINTDLKYLQGGISTMTYMMSTTKTKAAQYDFPGIEDMVPNIWSPVKVAYDKYALWDNVSPSMLLQEIQGRGDVVDFTIALRMFTRSLVIQKRVEDLQLGVESHQKKINVTKPDTTRPDLRKRHPYTLYKDPQGFIYVDDHKRNRLMCSDELYKFSDGTLTKLLSSLKDITKNIDMEYLPKRRWSNLEKKRAYFMIKDINNPLKERRMMRSLEKFIGERFDTSAGNPVKEILLKLNLPDHRSILTDSKEYLKMVMEIILQELSDEQALHPNTDQSASSPVKIEALRELHKMEAAVQQYHVDKQCFEIQKKQFLIENDRLLDQIISQDIVNIVVNSSLDINTSVNVNSSVAMNDSVNYVEMCNKSELQAKDTTIEKLKANIKRLNKNSTINSVKKDIDEIETINIELEHRVTKLIAENDIKNDLRKFKRKYIVDNVAQASNATTIALGMYKLDLVTLTPKDKNNRETHIYYLKHTIEQAAILREIVEQSKSLNPLDSASYSAYKYVKLIQELLEYVRETCPDIHKPSEKLVVVTPINKKKTVSSMFDARHELCFLEFVSDMNASSKSKSVKKTKKKEEWKPTGKVFTKIGYIWRPTGRTFTLVVKIILWYLDSGCSKHMTGDHSQLTNFVHKFLGTIKFGNDQIIKIMGYGDYQIENITILRVYYVEGLGHNIFFVGQFCDSDLEVAFRKHTYFVRNLEGVDLLSGYQETNLYTLSIGDMMTSSPIFLLSKASKTKS